MAETLIDESLFDNSLAGMGYRTYMRCINLALQRRDVDSIREIFDEIHKWTYSSTNQPTPQSIQATESLTLEIDNPELIHEKFRQACIKFYISSLGRTNLQQ